MDLGKGGDGPVMKRAILILILSLAPSLSPVQGQTSKYYINVAEENLRAAPNGKKLGVVLEGTETTMLIEKDNWVKVQITGWIWKPSLSKVKLPSLSGEYRARHILVKTRAEAEQIMAQLNGGMDFAELAKSSSISPSAAKGGDLGYFNKGDFDPQIEDVITNLEIDQTSDIIETEFGFNIFKRVK